MEPEVVVDFYGVYLLCCTNPQHPGRTYVGYTRDPTRRLAQHNRGVWAGGAHSTNNRGPWKMVMIIHGFPNNIAALRFEWAWQHPELSTRLQHLTHPRRIPRKEKEFPYRLRILAEMLRTGPWDRLPLTVRWLEQDYCQPLPVESPIPRHMIIKHGPVKSKNISRKKLKMRENFKGPQQQCARCYKLIDAGYSKLNCTGCSMYFHVNCLADVFLEDGEYVPIRGNCPNCYKSTMWGDLIRNMKCGEPGERISCGNGDSEPDSEEELSQVLSLNDGVEMGSDDGL